MVKVRAKCRKRLGQKGGLWLAAELGRADTDEERGGEGGSGCELSNERGEKVNAAASSKTELVLIDPNLSQAKQTTDVRSVEKSYALKSDFRGTARSGKKNGPRSTISEWSENKWFV